MQISWLCCLGWPQNKIKREWKKDKYLDLARELKKLWKMKVTIIPFVIGAFNTVTRGLLKGLEDLYHPNYDIIANGQNTEKIPMGMRELAVTQTPVKDHQLTLTWKTPKKEIIITIIIRRKCSKLAQKEYKTRYN